MTAEQGGDRFAGTLEGDEFHFFDVKAGSLHYKAGADVIGTADVAKGDAE